VSSVCCAGHPQNLKERNVSSTGKDEPLARDSRIAKHAKPWRVEELSIPHDLTIQQNLKTIVQYTHFACFFVLAAESFVIISHQSIPSGNTIGPLTALRFSGPHNSSTNVSANGKEVPGPRLYPRVVNTEQSILHATTNLVIRWPETTTLSSLYSKSEPLVSSQSPAGTRGMHLYTAGP
jgi:hypothetical protein